MKLIKITALIFGMLFCSCNQTETKNTFTKEKISSLSDEKIKIKTLIKKVFKWTDSKNSISVFPVLTDSKDYYVIGLDHDLHKKDLETLRKSNLFSLEFINNYNKIVLTLDKNLKNGKYEQWLVGELPPFYFANDYNPWCYSQGDCSGESFDLEIIKLDNKEGVIKYKRENNSSWNDFIFKVKKENENWKISYLEGFDYKERTK